MPHDGEFFHEHVEMTEAQRLEIARCIWDQETVELKTIGIDVGGRAVMGAIDALPMSERVDHF